MAEKTLLHFKTVPPKSSYFPDNICWVPTERAEEWIFDNYATDAEKTLPAAPYFAPEEVEALDSVEKVNTFIDKQEDAVNDSQTALTKHGSELERISGKITALQKKRDAEKVGSYQYVKFNTQVEELKGQLPKLEKQVTKLANDKKQAEILLVNARIKFIEVSFRDLAIRKEYDVLKKKAAELIEHNEKVKEIFRDATAGFSLGFQPDLPFLSDRYMGAVQNTLAKSEDVIKRISDKMADKLRSKLWTFYREDFEGKLEADD